MRARPPRRVLLFCPATDRDKIEKAARLEVDAVILDLEDAVPASRKQAARRTAIEALADLEFRGRRLVRLNPRGRGLEDDLRALARAGRAADGYVVPKVESSADLRAVRPPRGRRPALLAIIESARGIVNLARIAAAHPRLEALIFGAEDLVGDLGGVRTPAGLEVLCARSAVALHAAAAGLQAIDTPFIDLRDTAGLEAQTREALALGYHGKLAIHPAQVAPILAVFTPSAQEVQAASALLRAYRRHADEGRGVFVLDGRMIDLPMVRAAEHVIERARRAGVAATDHETG